MKNKTRIIFPILLISSSVFVLFQIKNGLFLAKNTSLNIQDSSSLSSTDEIVISSSFQKLSVLPLRCIGCGKCARIDSAHFEINPTTGKAIVISSTNLNSQNLIAAINNCRSQAIILE